MHSPAARALGSALECYHGSMRMPLRDFELMVEQALAELPAMFRSRLENVEVLIAERPTHQQRAELSLRRSSELMGLYEGTPLTERGSDHGMTEPDRITLFRPAILSVCRDADEVREEVRRTVLHELAHFFGIDDDRLLELGAY